VGIRPVPKPPKGLKDKDLLQQIKIEVSRCEWPDGCDENRVSSLASHHIFGRGGGRRDDHPSKIAVLCHGHHNMGPVNAHDGNHWTRRFKGFLLDHVRAHRSPEATEAIEAYMEERGLLLRPAI
jgi:hypothetical protein